MRMGKTFWNNPINTLRSYISDICKNIKNKKLYSVIIDYFTPMLKKPGLSICKTLSKNVFPSMFFPITSDPYSINPTLFGEDDKHWISYF